jgi:hypothetical protein
VHTVRSASQLFVVIATGQNVANFPPILECAQPGDKVLWLESPHAAQLNWRQPAEQALMKAHIEMLPPLPVPEEASVALWGDKLRESVARCRQQGWQPVLVLNGGHKLMALILWEIWRDLQPMLIYNFDRPAALWISESGLYGPSQLRPYRQHRFDLEEVLTLNHHQLHNRPCPGCVWCSYQPAEALANLPATFEPIHLVQTLLAQSSVGQRWRPLLEWLPEVQLRQAITAGLPESWLANVLNFAVSQRPNEQIYENIYHAALRVLKNLNVLPLLADWEFAYYDEMVGLVGKTKLQTWQRELWGLVPRLSAKERKQTLTPELLQKVFLKVCQQVYVVAPDVSSSVAKPAPAWSSGQQFELVVAKRVAEFLQDNLPAKQIVQSVYAGVKVSPIQEPQSVAAELDVLLVLKNGILIHIECKTGVWTRKDLDARLTNLRRLGSSIAVLAVCAPLFTDDEHFNLLRGHDTRMQLEKSREIRYLPFTKPGQPRHYTITGETGEEQAYEVEPFEQALFRLLQPYMLRSQATDSAPSPVSAD